MADFAGGKIKAYFGPPELAAHDDLEQVIIDFIAGAEQTLDIAVQEIDSIPIAEAIIDARWRGVAIDAYVEQDYLKRKLRAKPAPPKPIGDETPEQALRRVQWRRDEDDLTREATLAATAGS